ncbi:zinc finger CCCH domain-containing protein 10 [Anabrus simplex]|uniref:zinc finger CCCH domain-containing protein 10 n=1 Tax=Anabrus simplex TaxID=316456 RepID=UPI0034DD57BC
MSENGSDSSANEGLEKICRDFLRNVCRRGKRCKYLHPDEKEQEILSNSINGTGKVEYVFCHDYQNSQCTRTNCRFIHCTRDEESYFKTTGQLPQHILEASIRKGITVDFPNGRPGEVPVCKDYLKGECRRGGKCKFRHMSVREYEIELGLVQGPPWQSVESGPVLISRRRERLEDGMCFANVNNGNVGVDRDLGPPEIKRRHVINLDPQNTTICLRENHHHQIPNGHCFAAPAANGGMVFHADARSLMIEEENAMLRKKVEELKKQVSDLTATNEFLLDQNAQLRIGGKRTANVTAVTVPAVTITNTGAPTMQVQPITAQIQPAQAPTPQQMVNAAVAAGTLRTVTASVATVPVSIAAVAGAPVSIATVSMAPVQIPPPVVTMAQQALTVEAGQPPQQPGAPPPQGQQQNPQQGGPQTLPMSISGATAPLVSYPIMTQDLRPVLQTSLSH